MTDRTAPFLRVPPAWVAVLVALALTLVTWVTNRPRPVLGFEGGPLIDVLWLSFAVLVVGLVLVGAVIVTRVPGNHIGWVLVLTGLLHGLSGALLGYAYGALVLGWPLPGGTVANWAAHWAPVPAGVLTGFIFLLFPTGRLPSPRWHWPARLYVTAGAVFAIAAAIAVAILRYRLYAIDRIISRTVTYGLVVAVLGAVYAAGVVGLGAAMSGLAGQESSDLVVAASVLAVAALFGPVRSRVQRAVDRRFNRTGYQARLAVEAFAERLRDDVDVEAIRREVTTTAATAMQPTQVSVWSRQLPADTAATEGQR